MEGREPCQIVAAGHGGEMSVTPTVIEPETIQRHFVPAPALTRRLTIAAVLAALAALTGILAARQIVSGTS